jgi:purine-nucleoside phosphorylase
MNLKACIIPAIIIALSACTSPKQNDTEDTRFQAIDAAAKQCADSVIGASKAAAAKGLSGKYKSTSAFYVTTRINGSFSRRIAYAKSTYVDSGIDGSAWRTCMAGKNAMSPEIVFN